MQFFYLKKFTETTNLKKCFAIENIDFLTRETGHLKRSLEKKALACIPKKTIINPQKKHKLLKELHFVFFFPHLSIEIILANLLGGWNNYEWWFIFRQGKLLVYQDSNKVFLFVNSELYTFYHKIDHSEFNQNYDRIILY